MNKKKIPNINLVEMCFGSEDGGFDQECKYGNRVGQHSVYCHNDKSPWRTCHFGWYTGGDEPDNTCPCFKKNKNYHKSNEKNKDREELTTLLFMNGVKCDSIDFLIDDLYGYFETHTQKKVEEEREKVLEEVREIIGNSYWISGTKFVVNGKQEKMIVKSELLSKINKL